MANFDQFNNRTSLFVFKDKETEELGNKAENAIEMKTKMVDAVADRADLREDVESKRVDQIGKMSKVKIKCYYNVTSHWL